MRGIWILAAAAVLLCLGRPAFAAPPLAAYGKLPALDMVRLSPSGDKIAFVAVDGESRRLFVRKVGGDAIFVSPVGANKIRDLSWVGDDYVLIKASATAKFGNGALDKWTYSTRAELMVVLIVNLKTHSLQKMFDHNELDVFLGAVDFDYGPRLIGGRWYEFVHAFDTQKWHGNVYKVDLETGKYAIINTNLGDDYGYLIGANGEIAARTQYSDLSKSWSVFTGAHGSQTVVKRPSPLFTVDLAGQGRTAGTILVSDSDDQKDSYDEYPIQADAPPTPLFAGHRVAALITDPATNLLLGGLLDGGKSAVLFDPTIQRHFDAAQKAFGGYHITLESFSTSLNRMVVKTDGSDDSGTYWLIDMTTGKADELTAAYPAIGQKDVGPTRMFAYEAGDGLAMEGVLTLPPGGKATGLPLVVMPHGGPIGLHDRVGFDWWAQAFASRGYAVFQPNYRGSGGYGVPFRDAGMGEWGHTMLTDMSDGVAALVKAGIVDKTRVCIVGGSYGGYAALAGVTLQHGIYRCAVSLSGPSDIGAVMAERGDSDYSPGGRYNQKMFGVKFGGALDIGRISPLRHAGEAEAPILLIHGKDDTVVPYVHSLSMSRALEGAGKTMQLLTLDGEDHWLSRETTRVQTLEASVAWVQKYNPAP